MCVHMEKKKEKVSDERDTGTVLDYVINTSPRKQMMIYDAAKLQFTNAFFHSLHFGFCS